MVSDFDARRTSFGSRADDYDRVRPAYPDEAIRSVIGGAGATVVDLGAGTGRLVRRCTDLGALGIGVEPDPGMAAVAARGVPGRVVRASAEHVPLADGSVDAIVVGQAWHWFDPVEAVIECGRLLRAGGRIGVFRNLRDESEPWVAALGEIIGGEDRTHASSALTEEIELGGPFTDQGSRGFAHRQSMTPADLMTLVSTHSYVTTRPDAGVLHREVEDLVRSHPDLVGRDRIEMPYLCRLTRATRR